VVFQSWQILFHLFWPRGREFSAAAVETLEFPQNPDLRGGGAARNGNCLDDFN
jgi:hypothetical protein